MADGERPQALYHYTTLSGLLGIIGSGKLRATDVQFLNDAQELHYGRDRLCDELQRYADDLGPPGRDPRTKDGRLESRATVARSASEYLAQGKLTHQSESVYVACFCEDGDLLSQWRGYGTGGGYALGFKVAALAQLARADSDGKAGWSLSTDGSQAGASLVRVEYGPTAVEAVCRRVVTNVSPQPVGHPGSHGWAAAVSLAIPALAGVKHHAFREEQEWRLLVLSVTSGSSDPAMFRPGPLGVTPYVEIPMDFGQALESVVVGPSSYPDLQEHAVRQLLEANGIEDVDVHVSEALYRS